MCGLVAYSPERIGSLPPTCSKPGEVMEVPTNSVPTTALVVSSKSSLRSKTHEEWMSPVMMNVSGMALSARWLMRAWRSTR